MALANKRIVFDQPERLAVIQDKTNQILGYVVASSLREGLKAARKNGYRGGISVVLETNLPSSLTRQTPRRCPTCGQVMLAARSADSAKGKVGK